MLLLLSIDVTSHLWGTGGRNVGWTELLLERVQWRSSVLSTDHEFIPAECKRYYCNAGGGGGGTKHAGGRKTYY
jgi:hypothetical protein